MTTPRKTAPAKKTAAAKQRKPYTRTPDARDLPDPDSVVDSMEEDGNHELPARTTRHVPGGRQSAELAAALRAKTDGKPYFPFPPELPPAHEPYWIELVNSRPHDYFNRGDMPLLKLYCRAAHDIDVLDREIDNEGSVIENARGNPIVNPKVVVRSIAESRLLALSVKLRAQPASRFDSNNDKKQQEKTKHAQRAANAVEDSGDEDGDGLLASGSSGMLN